jgi:hypothetical protein
MERLSNPQTTSTTKNILVRIKDSKLYEELKAVAEKESRSINKQIVHFLNKSVDTAGKET